MALIEDTPETTIRTDLWHTMSSSELAKQQELMTSKMTAVMNMMGAQATPAVISMYQAMQRGMSDLNKLIDERNARER
jgi:hypothetical protein